MITAIGVDVDDTFAGFVQQALEADVPFQAVNLRAAVEGEWHFDVPASGAAMLRYGDETFCLNPEDAYYCRLIDLSWQLVEADESRRWQALLGALRAWLDSAPGLVVNRTSAGGHNSSKPLHETILRDLGFRVPESLTSSNSGELRDFLREGPAVSKTVCGTRADTIAVKPEDFEHFDAASGPVHLQRLVEGADARIHVIGKSLVAQRVLASNVDYRRSGGLSEMEIFDPPDQMRALLIRATAALDLAFAGWDFKIDADGMWWCLEANPMPGYGPYDERSDGAISRELLRLLGGRQI